MPISRFGREISRKLASHDYPDFFNLPSGQNDVGTTLKRHPTATSKTRPNIVGFARWRTSTSQRWNDVHITTLKRCPHHNVRTTIKFDDIKISEKDWIKIVIVFFYEFLFIQPIDMYLYFLFYYIIFIVWQFLFWTLNTTITGTTNIPITPTRWSTDMVH